MQKSKPATKKLSAKTLSFKVAPKVRAQFGLWYEPREYARLIDELGTQPAQDIQNQGQSKLLKLVNRVLRDVPGYRQFLNAHDNGMDRLDRLDQLSLLPPVNKDNYIREYSLDNLVFDQDFTTFSATSGTSGAPTYFPRSDLHDQQYELVIEAMLRKQFGIRKETKTLVINGFGMGVWIAGMFTNAAVTRLAEKGYQLSTVPVGVDVKGFVDTFQYLFDSYDHFIFVGYPPHIKEFIDEIERRDISLQSKQIRVITAAESYNENYRAHLASRLGVADTCRSFSNIYGSVELGAMGFETPLTILIRQLCTQNPDLFKQLFGEMEVLPTLVQYFPHLMHFEEENNELFATGYGSAIPLVRYQFFDSGGVIPYEDMLGRLRDCGINLDQELVDRNLLSSVMKLPFVFVGPRSNSVMSYNGINIYPSYVKDALYADPVAPKLTGRFKMTSEFSENFDQILKIYVESKVDQKLSKKEIENLRFGIIASMVDQSSEYEALTKIKGTAAMPQLEVVSEGKAPFGKKGHKEKWTQ